MILSARGRSLATMYNGIGLQTARGSGTNGHVTRNLSHVRAKDQKTREGRMEERTRKGVPGAAAADRSIVVKKRFR